MCAVRFNVVQAQPDYIPGEIDHYRDSKVSECFSELANVITPSHHLIGIPLIYQNVIFYNLVKANRFKFDS